MDEFEEWDDRDFPSTQELITQSRFSSSLEVLFSNLGMDDELIRKTNIKWVKEEGRKLPPQVKLPLVVGILKDNIDLELAMKKARQMTPSIVLSNGDEELVASLTPNFIKKYGSQMSSGCVLGFQNCSLLRTKKKSILCVRSENFACLVSTEEKESPDTMTNMDEINEGGCRLLKTKDIDVNKLSQQYAGLDKELSNASHSTMDFEDDEDEFLSSIPFSDDEFI